MCLAGSSSNQDLRDGHSVDLLEQLLAVARGLGRSDQVIERVAGNGQILGYGRRSRQTSECLRALSVRFDGPGGSSESQARRFELTTDDRARLLSASLWLPATSGSAERAVSVRSIHSL